MINDQVMTGSEVPPLGPHIRQLRKKRRLTLEQLAAQSGVSRSMLSQIERGEANPTFATLWNLTRALSIDLSELVTSRAAAAPPSAIEVVGAHFTPEIRSEDGLCTLRILSPAQSAGRMEWYEVLMAPGAALSSDPHARGAMEHLTVIEGDLEVVSGGARNRAAAGATLRYAADVAHEIRNDGNASARALLVVIG